VLRDETIAAIMDRIYSAGKFIATTVRAIAVLVSSLFRYLLSKAIHSLSSIWHGSITWGWFAVLLLGALTMTSSGEYGGGLVAAWLSIFSLGSKYWHWAGAADGWWKKLRDLTVLPIFFCFILCYFVANDMRGNSP
jgi:hypothetical protein